VYLIIRAIDIVVNPPTITLSPSEAKTLDGISSLEHSDDEE